MDRHDGGRNISVEIAPAYRYVSEWNLDLSQRASLALPPFGRARLFGGVIIVLGAAAPLANFEIQSPVTEAFLLGCIAQRFPGERIEWDTAKTRISNSEKLNAYVDPHYRNDKAAWLRRV